MQQTWRVDGDKLTFIVCRNRSDYKSQDTTGVSASASASPLGLNLEVDLDGRPDDSVVGTGPVTMVGDVNMFISVEDRDDGLDDGAEDDHGQANPTSTSTATQPQLRETVIVAELELMIAEKTQRGQGLGKATIRAFLRYVMQHEKQILVEFWHHQASRGDALLGVKSASGGQVLEGTHAGGTGIGTSTSTSTSSTAKTIDFFAVKIAQVNHKSIGLFEALGFTKVAPTVNYFGEWELRCSRNELAKIVLYRDADPAYAEVEYLGPSK